MGNHFHLLLETPEPNLASPQELLGGQSLACRPAGDGPHGGCEQACIASSRENRTEFWWGKGMIDGVGSFPGQNRDGSRRLRLVGGAGKNQPSEQTPLPSCLLLLGGRSAFRGMVENRPAGVAPVARSQVVRGAVVRRSGYGFPLDSSHKIHRHQPLLSP